MMTKALLKRVVLDLAVALTAAGGALGAEIANAPPGTEAKPTFWLVPHTHWEGAVFKTREEYLEMGLPHILTAVRLLKEHPNYRFALDQAAYFRPFLERYPEEGAAFRRFVAEGRLQIVCGLDVMPDDNMPGGEAFVRQILYAKGYCREALGVEVTVGWLLDTFGHHAQMPQVLRLAGYNSFWSPAVLPTATRCRRSSIGRAWTARAFRPSGCPIPTGTSTARRGICPISPPS